MEPEIGQLYLWAGLAEARVALAPGFALGVLGVVPDAKRYGLGEFFTESVVKFAMVLAASETWP